MSILINRIILLTLALMLAACTGSRSTWRESILPIHAFMTDGQYLYVIADDADMRFDQSSAAESLRQLEQFRRSKYAALPNRQDIFMHVKNSRDVRAAYYIRVPLEHLSAADQAELRRMGFTDFYGSQDKSITTHLSGKFEANGEITRFSNRDAILAQHRLQPPLRAKVTYHDIHSTLDWEQTLAAPLAIPTSVVGFPMIYLMFKEG